MKVTCIHLFCRYVIMLCLLSSKLSFSTEGESDGDGYKLWGEKA